MKRYLLPLLIALLPATSWAGPVCVDPEQPANNRPARDGVGGIGGTGQPAAHDNGHGNGGIGGTGHSGDGVGGIGGTGRTNDGSGGIGGTGAPLADGRSMGIVGVVSGFASVCVNGVEVHFDESTAVNDNGEQSSLQTLAVGQIVSIEATKTPKGLQAKDIAILHALQGPISKFQNGGKSIQVLGQTVTLSPNTRIGGNAGLAVGQMVKISALTGANGQLFATRVQPASGPIQAGVLGKVITQGKKTLVNGVPVSGTVNADAAAIKGSWNGNALVVTGSLPDPTYRFKNKVDRLLIEGLVQSSDGRGKIKAGGIELSVDKLPTQNQQLKPNQRIFVDASVSRNGEIVARGLEIEKSEKPVTTKPMTEGAKTSSISRNFDSAEKAEKVEKTEKTEKVEKDEKVERIEKPEKIEKIEKTEKVERIEKPEKIEKIEKVEKVEKVERIEKPEKIEKVERVEKPEKIERVERSERVERVEKPERIERSEDH